MGGVLDWGFLNPEPVGQERSSGDRVMMCWLRSGVWGPEGQRWATMGLKLFTEVWAMDLNQGASRAQDAVTNLGAGEEMTGTKEEKP